MGSDLQRYLLESPFLAVFIVFWAGAVASLGSCTILRVPVMVGVIAGTGSRRKALSLVALFLLGFVLCYTLLGVFLGFAASMTARLIGWSRLIYLGLGTALVVAGLGISGLIRFGGSRSHDHGSDRFRQKSSSGALFLGMGLALLEMPTCPACAPVLLVVAGTVFVAGSYSYAVLVFIAFALGQSLPSLLMGTSVGLAKCLTPRLARFEPHIRLAAGNILIVLGLYFVIIA